MDIEPPLYVLYRFPKVGIVRDNILHTDECPHNLDIDMNSQLGIENA